MYQYLKNQMDSTEQGALVKKPIHKCSTSTTNNIFNIQYIIQKFQVRILMLSGNTILQVQHNSTTTNVIT